jgi:hypothetical protein
MSEPWEGKRRMDDPDEVRHFDRPTILGYCPPAASRRRPPPRPPPPPPEAAAPASTRGPSTYARAQPTLEEKEEENEELTRWR